MAIMELGDEAGWVPHVLVAEGEPSMHRQLDQRLRDQGVVLTAVHSVRSALEQLEAEHFGVIVVDLVLPDGSGLEVLDAVRATGSVAHVIVMSDSADPCDRATAHERGADGYMAKPCPLRELTSRIVAVGRRPDPDAAALLAVGPLRIDLRTRQVHDADRRLELTAKEFDLLAFLAARPGYVFNKAELLRAVWHTSTPERAATVTDHIRRLRAKIELEPSDPRIVRTVRGSGYRLDLPGDDGSDSHHRRRFAPGTIIQVAGRIVDADEAAGALLGPTPEAELVGRQFFELAVPTSRQATRERLAFTGPGSARRTLLIDLDRTDGSAVSVEVACEHTSWNDQPAVQVTITHVPDVSARLRRLVTGVLSEVTDAVIITDLHFHLRSWNQAAERLYGWREHEVLGRHLLDIVQPGAGDGDDQALVPTWDDLAATGRWKGACRHRARGGSSIDVLSSTSLIRDHSGEPILIVAVNRPAPTMSSAHQIAAMSDDDQIRTGLDNGAFVVHYQPFIGLADDQVVGMEALVRWDHPDRGVLLPDVFMAAAERSGAIIEIGNVVFEKACAQAAEWRRAGMNLTLSINLSARQLADPALYHRITTVLASTGLDPHHLWLEVTETSLIDDVDRASAVLHNLADLGIGIAIDDFGTGWASLTYLRSFPIHVLKIDRSFVAGVGKNANDTAIVRSILALGAELGLAVVAEGIETRAQHRVLQKLGCTIGQGFLYGRPVPAADASVDEAARSPLAVTGSLLRLPPVHFGDGVAPPVWPSLDPVTRMSTSEIFTAHRIALQEAAAPVPDGDQPADSGRSVGRAAGLESDIVADLLRGLLRIRSAPAAADLLHSTIRNMGGTPVPATDAGDDVLPIDVSLGEGPPMLVEVEMLTVARMQLERLLPRMVEDARQAVDLLRQTERLVDEAVRDELTGLSNRRVLDRVLPRTTSGSVVMIDLDHFKEANDRHGHAAGDTVLVAFGKLLTEQVRAADTSCRFGGEEFALVLSDADAGGAVELVDRIRTAWSPVAPLGVTFSAGVAAVDSDGGTGALLAADRALYEAKARGRNRTEMASHGADCGARP